MAYPVTASGMLAEHESLTVTFRPAAAGLVNVIGSVLGLQPAGNGNGGGTGGHQPNATRNAAYQ